ncbi:hypothetical protein [Leifsonia sp. NPDC080035]|uniref:Integral membrane protein n=1 Tax=Leifsonia sp. NPDC080035 TaxID=3143936 RepID=A0AAU7GFH6_9MICO
MTTLEHRIPLRGVARNRGVFASLAGNAYLRLIAVLVVIAAGAALLTVGIGLALDVIVPVLFGDELHALAALLPHG